MKKSIVLFIIISVLSCTEKDVLIKQELKIEKTLTIKSVKNIYAPHYDMTVYPVEKILTEEFVKFDFEKGKIVEKEDDNWDIGFKGTTIIINGGKKTKPKNEPERTRNTSLAIVKNSFDEIKEVPLKAIFKKDKKSILAIPTGSDNGWFHYDFNSHRISPIVDRQLLIKTRLGKYVKMEIISFYKDLDFNKPSNYYSFNYVLNPEIGNRVLY